MLSDSLMSMMKWLLWLKASSQVFHLIVRLHKGSGWTLQAIIAMFNKKKSRKKKQRKLKILCHHSVFLFFFVVFYVVWKV